MSTRIGCTVEVIIEHGAVTGIRASNGFVHADNIPLQAGPPNLELQFTDGRITSVRDKSPEVAIFERIVAAMTREFPNDQRTVL